MKHLKKIITAAVLGFLAFAPPGTMIFIGVLVLGLLGWTWFITGVILGFIALGVYGFVYRERLLKARFVRKNWRKPKV